MDEKTPINVPQTLHELLLLFHLWNHSTKCHGMITGDCNSLEVSTLIVKGNTPPANEQDQLVINTFC